MLEYPPDVAFKITRILTCAMHLPTGGNASTLLSFWAYKPMFDEIAELAKRHGSAFTLYVDDMTITGIFANRTCQREARNIISRYGLLAHKAKVFSAGQPRVVTGVAKTRRGRELPHRRAKGIALLERAETATASLPEKEQLLASLIGKLSEATVVDSSWMGRKDAAVKRRRNLSTAIVRSVQK